MSWKIACHAALGRVLAVALVGGCSAQGAPHDFEDVTAQADEGEGLVAKLESPRGAVYFFVDDEGGASVAASRAADAPEVFDSSLLYDLPPAALYELLSGEPAPEALASLGVEPLWPEEMESQDPELTLDDVRPISKNLTCSDWNSTWSHQSPRCGFYEGDNTMDLGRHYHAKGEIQVRTGTLGDDVLFRLQSKVVGGYRDLASFRPKVGEWWSFWGSVGRYAQRQMRWRVTDARASGGILGVSENGYTLSTRVCAGSVNC